MDQVCFTGAAACSTFVGHMLKANICTNCMKDISKHKKDVVSQEDLIKALEFTQKGAMTPSLILEKEGELGALYLGGFKAVTNTKFIKEAGITGVVNVVGDGLFKLFGPKFVKTYGAAVEENNLRVLEFQWEDSLLYDISDEDLVSVARFIEEQRRSGGSVVVHCAQGKSRSTTAVLAYMMAKLEMTFKDALAFVQEKRKMADPNPHFRFLLDKFERSGVLRDLKEEMKSFS